MKVSSNMCFCVDKLRLDMFWYFVTSFSLLAKAILNALELLDNDEDDSVSEDDMEDLDDGLEGSDDEEEDDDDSEDTNDDEG